MQQQRNTNFKVGITVLVGLAVLIFGIGWAKSWNFNNAQHYLTATFPTVSGLERGDGVFIRGVRHGVVDQITESTNGTILVRMALTDAQPIHRDASAIISMLELMGGKKVDISPGSNGNFDLARDTLIGTAGGDISSLISFANSLAPTIDIILHKVDTVLNSVNDLFGNGALKQKTYAALDNAAATIADLRTVIKENRETLSRTLNDVDRLAVEGTNAIIQIRPGVSSTLDTVKDFIHHSQGTLARADTLLAGINQILAEARSNKSVLYKLTVDKEFSNKLDSMIQSASQFIRQIKKNGMDVNVHVF